MIYTLINKSYRSENSPKPSVRKTTIHVESIMLPRGFLLVVAEWMQKNNVYEIKIQFHPKMITDEEWIEVGEGEIISHKGLTGREAVLTYQDLEELELGTWLMNSGGICPRPVETIKLVLKHNKKPIIANIS